MVKAKTREQLIAERRFDIAAYEQKLEADRVARQAEQQAQQEQLTAMQAVREKREKALQAALDSAERLPREDYYQFKNRVEREAIENGLIPQAGKIPTLDGIFAQKAAEEQAERDRLEAERIAALTPRQIWMSTLNFQERKRIETWEHINGMEYPFIHSELT